MRWPWQRKPAPVASIAPARPRSDWRRVGTLRPTADVHAPTIVPTGLPVLASTRSLLYRERAESSAAPAGRVTGLALVSPVAQADPVSIVAPPVRPTVAARPVRSTLTRAVAEYVGEARVPAVPHRAPAWLRNAPPQVLTPLDAFAMPETSLPEIAVLDSWTTKPPALDRETPELIEEEPRPTLPIRRRRPGLGLPLPPGERPPMPTQKFRTQKFPTQKFPTQQLPAEQVPVQQMQPQNMQAQNMQTQQLQGQHLPMRQPVERPGSDQRPMVVDAPAPTSPETPKLVHPTVVPGRFSARVPADLAETFERAYGVDVADVAIDRSPAATAQARAMGAKAFAHHDLIVLPEDAGPVEAVEARALIGHELAHVVQQRTIGSVPTESGSDGQHLEAAARAVEQWVRAGASGPPPLVVPRSSERSGPPPVRRRANAGPPSSAGAPQRAPAGVATDPAAPPRQTARVVTSTSAATPAATLIHPTPTPATDHDPLNPRDSHEFGALVKDSFAHLGLDMFGIGGVLQQPSTPSRTTTPGSTGGSQGQVSQPATGATFNRDTRRQQLTEDTLQRINLVRAQQGEPATSELPETELAAIEMQLDAEQGGSGGQNSALPVIHNGAELKEQIRLGGGELLGAFIGYNPVEHQKHEAESTAHQQTSTTNGAGAPGATQPSATPGAHPDQPAPEPTGTELARLYDRIHTRLLRELLVGRERAGVLMDFR
jgi:hypothetical protein